MHGKGKRTGEDCATRARSEPDRPVGPGPVRDVASAAEHAEEDELGGEVGVDDAREEETWEGETIAVCTNERQRGTLRQVGILSVAGSSPGTAALLKEKDATYPMRL